MTEYQKALEGIYDEVMEFLEENPEKKKEYFRNNKLFLYDDVFYKDKNGLMKMFQKGSIVCNMKLGYGKQMVVVSFDENSIELEGFIRKDYLKDNVIVGYEDTYNMGCSSGAHLSIHPEFRKMQLESENNPDINTQITNNIINSFLKNDL